MHLRQIENGNGHGTVHSFLPRYGTAGHGTENGTVTL